MSRLREAVSELKQVLGEGAWMATVSAPLSRIQPDDGKTKTPRTRRQLGKGALALAQEAPASFPFSTPMAEMVWEVCRQIIPLYPTEGPQDIIRIAMEHVQGSVNELTPEDIQLLLLAVDYEQNGPAKTNVRIGGTPGGPFKSTGHRGAP